MGTANRLQAIAHANGSAITATYTLDPRGGLPLMVDNGINVTMILYGQAAVGEYAVQTAEWAYYLGDAQLSVRQLVDERGAVTQAQTYGPYGVLLHQTGDGGGLFGYQGGQSSANGLWYSGDGYFDPNTGQFLSRDGNPLLPLAAAAMANPGGFLLGPVLFISWRRRKGKKGVHPATLLLFGVLLAAGLSGCNDPEPAITVTPIPSPGATSAPPPLPPPAVSTPGSPDPTDEPPTIEPEPDPCAEDTNLDTVYILFSGRGGNMDGPGADPEIQTHVWLEKIKETGASYSVYQFPGNNAGGKTTHAANAKGNDYKLYEDVNLRIIGYSSGADSALLFADGYYKHQQTEDGGKGKILDIVLLGPTMTDNGTILNDNHYWTTVMDNLLICGTDIFLLNDNGFDLFDDTAENGALRYGDYGNAEFDYRYQYSVPSGAEGTLTYVIRPELEHIDDHSNARPGIGTNNSLDLVDEVFQWFEDY